MFFQEVGIIGLFTIIQFIREKKIEPDLHSREG